MSFPHAGYPLIPLVLKAGQQLLTTTADAALYRVPFDCVVVAIQGGVTAIGGSVDPTDVDLMVEKATSDLLSAVIPAVNGSAINAAGVGLQGTLVTTQSLLSLAAGDVLHLDVTITGGTSPTVDGAEATVWVVRKA